MLASVSSARVHTLRAAGLRLSPSRELSWHSGSVARRTPGPARPSTASRFVSASATSMAIEGTVTAPDATLEVVRVPMFQNNYGWILRDVASGVIAAVDPAEPLPIDNVLKARGWKLGFILNTHHHQDHVGGNSYLKDAYGCKIYGPAADKARIPLIDETFADGDSFKLGETELRVFDTPGHTRGHITFWAPEAKALFPGDTLFAMGCGRLFEGTPEQMWTSLSKLKDLPPETQVFCAHEYTESNAKWAVTVDPENSKLKERAGEVMQQRKQGEATIPSTLAQELATNPFMRPDSPAIRAVLSVPDSASNVECFAAIRASKDKF